MREAYQALLGLCIFRAGPQDIPPSHHLLGLLMAMSMGISYLGTQKIRPGEFVLLEVLLVTAFTLAFVYGALAAYGLASRFVQTGSAVFGSNFLLAMPAYALTIPIAEHGEDATMALLALMVVLIWHLGILSHIFRHAFDISLGVGVLIAIVYYILSSQISWLVAA